MYSDRDKQNQEEKLLVAAMRRLESITRIEAFDPYNPDSRPNKPQQEVIDDFGKVKQQWIRAGNQGGKSLTCSRIISWVLADNHPTWRRPKEWLTEPLLIIVAGRTGKQIEDSLLPKITAGLEPGTYKEVRIGNIIQRLELDNGNKVIFQSLENPRMARERLQSYVAHIVWVDELPPTMEIVRELQIRVQSRNGYFIASFTPTSVNVEIQRFVDQLKLPEGKVYRFNMLDNPLYADPVRRQELIDRYSHLPQHVQDVIFRGEWMSGDDLVYFFDYDKMVDVPLGYSPLWRHVESVDPAISSALGLTVWAEDPHTNVWYCILAEYVKGILVPSKIIETVQERVRGLNIVKRISDPHEVWYIQTAGQMGIHYGTVYKKSERKHELIKNFQQALGGELKLCPQAQLLIQELQECRWSDRAANKIINGSSYHLLDSAQYFCDTKPSPQTKLPRAESWYDWLYRENEKRKTQEAVAEEMRKRQRMCSHKTIISRRRKRRAL